MTKEKKHWFLLLPPVLLLLVILLHTQIAPLAKAAGDLYTCPLRAVTGIHCPGCGGTRSMLELLHGHPLRALHDNPASPLLVLTAILWYCEHVLAAFGKPMKLIPRSTWFWAALLVLHLIWSVVRLFVPELLPLPLS